MTGDHRMHALAAAAAATALGLAVVVTRAQTPSHRPDFATGPRVQRAARRPTRPVPALDRRHALVVAKRFAVAYAEWDAGHRDQRRSRRLARVSTPALFAALSRDVARPVARRPRSLPLTPMSAYPADGGSFLVPVLARDGPYVMTLVVASASRGARVAQIRR
jgi:hypothetical protein